MKLLDISAALILAGFFGMGLYETIALINSFVPFTHDIPLITNIVRPWVSAHINIALAIAALIFASFFWLFFHFYLPQPQ